MLNRSLFARRPVVVAATLVIALLGAGLSSAPRADAHNGDPRYRSVVREIAPSAKGLDVRVVNYDDSLALVNDTGEDVVVYGYQREPYARIAADGTVSVNRGSPAGYLNDDRYAQSGVPDAVREHPRAAPRWEVLDRTGRFTWHDHRMHWMVRGIAPQVRDESRRTKIFDYAIPIAVGTTNGSIDGTLWWVGEESSGVPLAAIVLLVVIVVVALVAVVVVRRRRERIRAGSGEAW